MIGVGVALLPFALWASSPSKPNTRDFEEKTAHDVDIAKVAQAFGTDLDPLNFGGYKPRVSVTVSIARTLDGEVPGGFADFTHRIVLHYSPDAFAALIRKSLPGDSCKRTYALNGFSTKEHRAADGWPELLVSADIRTRSYKCIRGNRITPRVRKTVGVDFKISLKPVDDAVKIVAADVDVDERLSRIDRTIVDMGAMLGGLSSLTWRMSLGTGSFLMARGERPVTVPSDGVSWTPTWFESGMDPFTAIAPSAKLAIKHPGIEHAQYACKVVLGMQPDPSGSTLSRSDDGLLLIIQESSKPRDYHYPGYYASAFLMLKQYIVALQSTSPKQETTYVVQGGDSLWGVAQRFYGEGTLYHAISDASGVSAEARLDPGLRLTVPRYIDLVRSAMLVRKGESLWKISREYKESDAVFQALTRFNHDPDIVYPSQSAGLPTDAEPKEDSQRLKNKSCENTVQASAD